MGNEGRTQGSGPALCSSLAPVYRDDARLLPLIGPGAPFEVEERVIDGIRLRSFVRAPRTILDCFQMGKAHADMTHLVYEDERWSFAQVRDCSLRLARALRASFGVGPGDRVAIAMRNLPEFVLSFWGAALNGAIAVPLNSWWTGPELRYALENCGAKLVFVDPERLERVRGAGQPAGAKLVAVRGEDGDARFDELIRSEPLAEDEIARPGPDDPVTILYTSGTTGRPKGALGTHRGAIANLWNMAFVNAREALLSGRKPAPPRQPATLSAAPLFHIGGAAAIIGGPMGGTKMVLMRKWNVEDALRLAQQEQLTSLGGVPAMARELFEHPRIRELGLDVRSVPMGGSAVPPDLPLRALEIFGKSVQILNGYGLTETTSAVVTNVGFEFAARPGSVGRPNLTADLKVVDADGRELGTGEVGELCMRSPQVVQGYWNDEAGTKAAFVDGWFHSGDVGYVDGEGFVYVVDRIKDVVIRGGENVYCAEVEAVLHDHPAVAEVAIVGLEDRVLGERVCAVVVPRPGHRLQLAELRAFASQRLAAFKCPEALLVIHEELPKTATSKLAKNELRALVRARAAAVERLD
jgi:acyl-CoA synthetase (AMP-forming)/AMP-acid ligase II